jgi:hypothetical protein
MTSYEVNRIEDGWKILKNGKELITYKDGDELPWMPKTIDKETPEETILMAALFEDRLKLDEELDRVRMLLGRPK